jgi:FlaG/FlaF family flagellin (archaellin)
MKNKGLSLVIAVALVMAVALTGAPAPSAWAAGTILYYPTNVAQDAVFSGTALTAGTPFAVYTEITGAPASTSCNGPKVRLLSLSTGGTADANFRTWTDTTNGWLTDSGAWASFPTITTDASGSWSGWAYGAVPSTATNTWLSIRIRCGTTNYDITTRVSVTLMNMTNSGGWLDETDGTARAGRAVVVKNGTTIVGMYVAEDNSVTEGYSGSGYFKVAVPNCTTCGYTIETWNLAAPNTAVDTVNTMGLGGCLNDVTAAGTTSLNSCTTPTAITLNTFSGSTPTNNAWIIVILLAAAALLAGGWALRRRTQA